MLIFPEPSSKINSVNQLFLYINNEIVEPNHMHFLLFVGFINKLIFFFMF